MRYNTICTFANTNDEVLEKLDHNINIFLTREPNWITVGGVSLVCVQAKDHLHQRWVASQALFLPLEAIGETHNSLLAKALG